MDLKFFSGSKYTFLSMGILSVIIISLLYRLNSSTKTLPIFQPSDINPRLVDNSLLHIRKDHKVGGFSLMNQDGIEVTEDSYKGKIYVSDFFFTRCATICPIMTSQMKRIQDAFKEDDRIGLLSHSVTPVMDSVPVLKAYAIDKGAISGKWNITTGSKKEIYKLARKNYFSVLDEGDGGVQDFIHTEQFVLVDTQKRLRGFYDGTSTTEVDKLIEDIKVLIAEEFGK